MELAGAQQMYDIWYSKSEPHSSLCHHTSDKQSPIPTRCSILVHD